MDLLIKGGTVINVSGRRCADVAVSNGKIVAVGENLVPDPHTDIVEASGLFVLPGAIDVHTHFELPFGGGISSADDFFTGTRAAACGGVTMVIDFVTPPKSPKTEQSAMREGVRSGSDERNKGGGNYTGGGLMDAFKNRNALAAAKACIDYSLHMGLSEVNDAILDEMDTVVKAGIASFKVFMTYEFRVTDNELKRALERAVSLNAVVMVHAEEHRTLENLKAKFIAEGKTDAWHHYLSRPESVEAEAVKKAVWLAETTGASLYIVHLACAGGLSRVAEAKREGYPIFAETCPQYLGFTRDVYKRDDGRNFVCSPPIKGSRSREALWQGVKDGSIDTVATDHCPFMTYEKARGKDDFTKIPNGVMGVENLYPYMLSSAGKGSITFERAVELCCYNPAKIFGCVQRKGGIAVGLDADIVIYDPSKEFTVSHKNMHSQTDYTIWEGFNMTGYPVRTYSRGILVYKNGDFLGSAGHGKFIKRKRI